MDALSSSFITTNSLNLLRRPQLNPPTSPPLLLNVSSIRTEDRPQTQTTTRRTTSRPNNNNNKSSSPPPPPSKTTTTTKVRPSNVPTKSTPPTLEAATWLNLPTTLCNSLDGVINNFIDTPLRPSVDPKHVLSDNFFPVEELPPTECPDIEGELPPCLDGAYIRNGPNPQHIPRGPHHLFDGDGMLHSLRISRGRATLCSRYVRTYKYTLEQEAGHPVLPNVFSGFNGFAGIARGAVTAARVLTGQFDPRGGVGLANTSLAFLGDRLFALGESDLPYVVRLSPEDGDITTIGRCDFDGRLSFGMTAHPKKDPETGEMFAFRYGPVPPFLTYFTLDSKGEKRPDVPIFSMRQPSFLHDFAITKKYALFCDIQLGMSPMDMIIGGGSPVGSDPAKVPRIGVLPRYATDESQMRWFDVPGFNMMHSINAWDDDDDTIVLIAPNILMIEHALERMDLVHCSVERVKIDLKSGTVSRTPLSERNLDFGVINPDYLTKRNRYAYMGLGDPMPMMSGVVKLDLEQGKAVATRVYGPGCYGGEPFFVPQGTIDSTEEDDGYVVSYVHDEVKGESSFVVMDAKSSGLDVVATVKLPRRVPYGFHGLFVSEDELRKQRPPVL
ncbi:hypothetical protein QJS10_CPB20g01044 [Acorus calamus]|uniref:Carotenoid cleavage dioxygenase 4 n=1 Tax=Acorus calamus TaxID=4465 RepID=A0AAV9CDY1_ACOCL|nr:hypothetical protein QJS10_CPB20g01044 [Acorus calamus]